MLISVPLQAAIIGSDSMPQFILIGGMLLVFYFFMIRPQQRRQREQRSFLAQMKKGTHVVTIGGIHGKIYEVAADTVTLEVDHKGTKITVSRGAISLDSTKQHTAKKK
ncbi:MAG: preprotein translocase subunit YajC [Bacteroidota bacterium]